MNRKILILVMAIIAIAVSFFVSKRYFQMSYYNSLELKYLNSDIDVLDYAFSTANIITDIPIGSPERIIQITPTQAMINQQESEHSEISSLENNNSAIANIKISTNKKTRTFDIMPNVDEQTLKENIGHLPSSALPGQEGLCVLMGHRDTDFSILQYANEGDVFTINFENSNIVYVVTQIEIVSSDSELSFKTRPGANLVLVTCYPFRYTGHAPQKIIVYSKII